MTPCQSEGKIVALAADVYLPRVSDNDRNRIYFLHWNNSAGEARPRPENWLSTKRRWGLSACARDGNPVMQDCSSSSGEVEWNRGEGVGSARFVKEVGICRSTSGYARSELHLCMLWAHNNLTSASSVHLPGLWRGVVLLKQEHLNLESQQWFLRQPLDKQWNTVVHKTPTKQQHVCCVNKTRSAQTLSFFFGIKLSFPIEAWNSHCCFALTMRCFTWFNAFRSVFLCSAYCYLLSSVLWNFI